MRLNRYHSRRYKRARALYYLYTRTYDEGKFDKSFDWGLRVLEPENSLVTYRSRVNAKIDAKEDALGYERTEKTSRIVSLLRDVLLW